MIHFPQELKVVTLHAPNAAPTADGYAVNLDTTHQMYVVVNSVQNAAVGIQIIPERNDAAGTGWIAFAETVRIWTNANTATDDVLVRQTDAVDFTQGAAAAAMQTVLQIDNDSLGLHTASGDPCTRVQITLIQGDAGDVASVEAFLVPRYPQATVGEIRV